MKFIPYYEDGFFYNIKGGEKVSEDLTFDEWEEKFVKDNGLTSGENSGTIKENHNKASIDMSIKNSIIQCPHRKAALDVTDEYLQLATPAQGSVTYDIGYNKSKHKDEIKMSDWLLNIRRLNQAFE